jgi:hypothetical protein
MYPIRRLATHTARLVLGALLLTNGAHALAIEEPDYQVLDKKDAYEIRRYASYIVAEVDVDGDFKSSGGSAFRILAGYIFGDNQGGTKMAMTAPVETRAAENGTTMNMTAPVTTTPSAAEAQTYTYAFVMESQYSMETLPKPNDPRIRLREVPSRTVAAHRYSGRWTPANYREHETLLLAALRADDIQTTSRPMIARYNGPMTPWFMRRNEVLVDVAWPSPAVR